MGKVSVGFLEALSFNLRPKKMRKCFYDEEGLQAMAILG